MPKQSKYILLTRLDSDDMLTHKAIEEIQKEEYNDIEAIIYENGYVLLSGQMPSIFRRIKWHIGKLLTNLKLW